jgi:TetR/AcrR family transcriptional regulator, cholesterol catabolism regulator
MARPTGRSSQRPAGPAAAARDSQRRREELIEIACRVFAEKGFDGATLQDIAEEFGVLKGSLFHYIQSKDDLLFEIIEAVYLSAEDAIWAIASEDGDAVARLRRVITAYVRYVTEHQPAVTVWLHDSNALAPAHRALIRKYEETDRRRMVDLVTEAQREGGIPADTDPRIVSMALLGALNWVHRWFRPGGLSAEEIGAQFGLIFLPDPTTDTADPAADTADPAKDTPAAAS